MKYQFKCDVRAMDLWQLSMSKIYHSIAGVCNLIYTVALIFVTIRMWSKEQIIADVVWLILCSVFLVLQPVAIYLRAKKQVAKLPKELEIGLDDQGIHIMTKEQNSHVKWKVIKQIRKENNMIIIFTNTATGLILTNRVLKELKQEVWNYITTKQKALSS